jgi:methanogen homoisocitrate dehydrogenase
LSKKTLKGYLEIGTIGPEISWTKSIVIRRGSEKIEKYACKLAKNKFTIVHKSNFLQSDKLFLDVCRWIAS